MTCILFSDVQKGKIDSSSNSAVLPDLGRYRNALRNEWATALCYTADAVGSDGAGADPASVRKRRRAMTSVPMDAALTYPYPPNGGASHGRAGSLYAQARQRARRGQLWSKLTGRSRQLLALKEVEASCAILDRTDEGTRPVLIRQIRGSAGRSRYFDSDFNPLFDRARSRWLNIAKARQQAKELPPVALVQVGEVYFVSDGHHRISVARALGESHVDARVMVWEVAGELPWDRPELAPKGKRPFSKLLAAAGI